MPQGILGIHDWNPEWARMVRDAGQTGWCVTTHALSEQNSYDFREMAGYGVVPIARLNWGYGSTGTIPLPDQYPSFAQHCADFVAHSPGCNLWLIGNEPNLAVERPNGVPILPYDYAHCYALAREAIRRVQSDASVLVAAIGPWNVETKYDANPSGDWLIYYAQLLAELLDSGADGLALHAYTHGSDPALIDSTETMEPPYDDRYYHFLCYLNTLAAVPPAFRHLPAYILECDQDVVWTDVNDGWMCKTAMEIDSHNKTPGAQRIQNLIFYRWSGDRWALEGKQQRLADFAAALALGIESPLSEGQSSEATLPLTPPLPSEPGNGVLPPPLPGPEPEPEPTPIEWDPRLTLRGASISPAIRAQSAWRCTVGRWFNEQESQGRHNVYVDVRNADGGRPLGTIIHWGWPGETTQKVAENKSDPWLTSMGIDGCAADFPMHHTAPTYWTGIGGVSDVVEGLGLGDLERPGMNIHTSYYFLFELVVEPEPEPEPEPGPEPGPEPPEPGPEIELVHPLPGAVITQHWGENSESYARFGMWGHNGVDLAGVPEGTPICAMADGVVAWVDTDPGGYGEYIRLAHEALSAHTFYGHMQTRSALRVGDRVKAGQTIGHVGNTGNSTAPHLHFEIRDTNPDGSYCELSPMPKGRVDPETWACLHGVKL